MTDDKRRERMHKLMHLGIPSYIRVYDNGGETADRYTVVYTGRYRTVRKHEGQNIFPNFQYVGMSGAPFHPQGFCQHGESDRQIDTDKWGWATAYGRKCHLGRRVRFTDLPKDCQQVVAQDYARIWDLDTESAVTYWRNCYEHRAELAQRRAEVQSGGKGRTVEQMFGTQ